MNHKLFEQLNKAGFPFKKELSPESNKDKMVFRDYITLDDLKEACGKEFRSLEKMEEEGLGVWYQAHMTDEAFERLGIPCVVECDGYETGDTPEEAMVRLWLTLNSK